ncbi:UDP-Glc:alpha-D-GlcNAc-diphosphoundecaprenol beta-1,3-glucosyltransferase WfgD [Aquisphaera giovannonii]|uniref:UDP-Glc:alpha-D-GlcNAc-diphosphoundecaprenol beta-1,3-glucosyltransferase WfgD n=1 Tax=Aquisphaera giovannonii TaxID=406548 RepID=A0A5B9WDH4_9BACT|nr:glycosyltransferase family A protein [Aquisphaera giovannonii]QEH38557.1 UDP-Glc:alpha-D-GlcNAc-diphosphoundecaprenol beta-1,3-glucosyltransferase WfgD [Aquisphaera giovannonii]
MAERTLKVSIIMPTYRRPHTIGQAIGSVLAQTHADWELIVSDNAGDGYRFDDPRIVVLDSRGVASAAYARNRAIPLATGDLVSFLDDDDELDPTYLETLAGEFRSRPALQMVKCQMIRRGELNETYGTPTVLVRRPLATPSWEPMWRQDRSYFQAIIDRHGLSEAAGTLAILPRALCRSGVDPTGGLRAGGL